MPNRAHKLPAVRPVPGTDAVRPARFFLPLALLRLLP